LCARGTGIGADGVVFLEAGRSAGSDFAIRYYNADGGRAELCGNASLCSVALATRLGGGDGEVAFDTDAGVIRGRWRGAAPQIDVGAVRALDTDFDAVRQGGERRIGYARVGVPHLVILCDDVDAVDLDRRGRELRWAPVPDGANANFVSRAGSGWKIRTFERGVEGETLACGTGAVATGALLERWGEAESPVALETRSGRVLRVTLRRSADGSTEASLSGEGRLVYRGRLGDVFATAAVGSG
jgi:diaminopimelate epimerase